jgi:molybdopterin/thiamine biosynthesis adenylyltransferase
MSADDYLARVRGRIDPERLAAVRIVQFGVGSVGSAMTVEFANSAVRHFRLIDGDPVEQENIVRHELKQLFVGRNKAEGMADLLRANYPTDSLEVESVPRWVDDDMSNKQLDALIEDADLVVAATDDRSAQWRIAERALANDVPAVFPALYEAGGGEVFVSLGPRTPCLQCWEAWRPENENLRAVSALNVEGAPIISLAVQIALGILDPSSEFARILARDPGDRTSDLRTLFVIESRHAALQFVRVNRTANCRMCQVGPARPEGGPNRLPRLERTDTPAAVRVHGATVLACLWALTMFLVAATTRSPVATVFLAASLLGALYVGFRPTLRDVIRRFLRDDFRVLVGALLNLGLLVLAVVHSSAALIVVLTIALTASGVTFLSSARGG